MVLFEVDPTTVLAAQVREEFRSKGTVTGFQVRIFVENGTAYLKKHMTGAIKREEQSGRVKVDDIKTDGKKRRANSYPKTLAPGFVLTLQGLRRLLGQVRNQGADPAIGPLWRLSPTAS